MLRAIVSSPINLLLLVAPVSWVLAATSPGSPWVFITAAASLIPLAGLIGLGTEQLARRATATSISSRRRSPAASSATALDRLCFWSALILIGAYGGSLVYAFTAQRDLFRPDPEGAHAGPLFSTGAAVGVLAAGTLLTTCRRRSSCGRWSRRSRASASPSCSSA